MDRPNVSAAGEAPASAPAAGPAGERLVSLDALRGFDMFWIVGGGMVVRSSLEGTKNPCLHKVWEHFEHVEWEGFHFFDLIFPLFLFIIGAALPYSLGKRLARGDSKRKLYGHILLRVAVLILLGMMVNGNLLSYDYHKFHITYSVLQMLALGFLVASIVYLNCSLAWQIAVTAGMLILYWLLLTFVPLPSHHMVGVYQPGANFGDWLNDWILGEYQGKWRLGWILGIMPHSATCMLGVFAGTILRSSRSSAVKVGLLVALGLASLLAGWGWSFWFPMIKVRWTSTFALFAGGWSYLLLAGFYLVIDVLGYRKWAFPWIVIGMNSIFAYMAWNLGWKAFRRAAQVFTDGLKPYVGAWHEPITIAAACGILWLMLFWMYRKGTFLRI